MADLSSFPRPNVAVDVAVMTIRDGRLVVLVQHRTTRPRGPALPGRFLRPGETVRECVRTALREKVDLDVPTAGPALLRVFDTPGRDPRGWTLSLAHCLVLPPDRLAAASGELIGVDTDGGLENGQRLLFDHDAIVSAAAIRLRERYENDPDPDGLLDEPFTLADLQSVHEAVLGAELLRDTFRRRMQQRLVEQANADGTPSTRSTGGRRAQLFVRGGTGELPGPARRRLRLPRNA